MVTRASTGKSKPLLKFPLAQTQLSQSMLVYQDPELSAPITSQPGAEDSQAPPRAFSFYVLCCEKDVPAEAGGEAPEPPRWFLKRFDLDQMWLKGLAQVLK